MTAYETAARGHYNGENG